MFYVMNLRGKFAGIILFAVILISVIMIKQTYFTKEKLVIGAFKHIYDVEVCETAINTTNHCCDDINMERFTRPSNLITIKLKYDFKPKKEEEVPPYIAEGFPVVYQTAEDVVHGYYAILKNAANMKGYSGGCGTILWMDEPYPYAYSLFSNDFKENNSLQEFINSFKGTGGLNLIQLTEAFAPKNIPDNVKYYFVEVEVLKGHKYKDGIASKKQANYFEYYYGIVTTMYDKNSGWKINSIDYLPEIYLCHPVHGWSFDYCLFMDVVYNDWYKMNLEISCVEEKNNYIEVYANNNQNKYKFDFIRLANGVDILLHEYIDKENKWNEITILKPDVINNYKMSILYIKPNK